MAARAAAARLKEAQRECIAKGEGKRQVFGAFDGNDEVVGNGAKRARKRSVCFTGEGEAKDPGEATGNYDEDAQGQKGARESFHRAPARARADSNRHRVVAVARLRDSALP